MAEPRMAKKYEHPPKTAKKKFYRCRVEASAMVRKEERSIRLGPGLLISEKDYNELVELGYVKPEWFDTAEEEEV